LLVRWFAFAVEFVRASGRGNLTAINTPVADELMFKGTCTTAVIAIAFVISTSLCKTNAMEAAISGKDPSATPPEIAMPVDALGYLGGLSEAHFYEPHATTDDPREEIRQAALLYGIDLAMMLSIAKVESDFNPRARTGSYKGLFQLGNYEFEKYGDGSIWDARDNARAAAHMFLVQADKFKWALGHFPDYAERYMVHQQGIEGAIEHYEHPERVAWQSMCATSEGLLKGEQWCKRCIWGNFLPRWKHDFGSVEKISSGDFVSLWTGRINLLAGRYSRVREAASTNPYPGRRASVPLLTVRSHSRMHRIAARRLAPAVVSAAKTGGILSWALAVASTKPTRATPRRTATAERRRGIAPISHRLQRQALAVSR
jgi:predicted GIY-YIG superfamily endonuclease